MKKPSLQISARAVRRGTGGGTLNAGVFRLFCQRDKGRDGIERGRGAAGDDIGRRISPLIGRPAGDHGALTMPPP